jgi:hypothetical protein
MRWLLLLGSLLLLGCPSSPEGDPWECLDDTWAPGACNLGESLFAASTGASHIDYDTELTFAADPPSSGNHRPEWGVWGEYQYIPPGNWLHNLEHGGAALLFHPCADDATVDALRDFARARADDDGGAFRWILTPYADLPSAIAVVTWEWTSTSECVDEDEIEAFLVDHYRQAPEDVAGDGSYNDRWISR